MIRQAIRFRTDTNGYVLGYTLLPYKNYVKDLRSKGHKPHLAGFTSSADAEVVGNAFTGRELSSCLISYKETH